MTPPVLFGDLAAEFLARTWHRQGDPMKRDHDPQYLLAAEHLRQYLDTVLANLAPSDRGDAIDALFGVADIHTDVRTEPVTVDGRASLVQRQHAALTIRHPWASHIVRADTAEAAR